MQLVHSATGKQPKKNRQTEQEKRSQAWMARFHQRQYDKKVAKNWAIIEQVREIIPGWLPPMKSKLKNK